MRAMMMLWGAVIAGFGTACEEQALLSTTGDAGAVLTDAGAPPKVCEWRQTAFFGAPADAEHLIGHQVATSEDHVYFASVTAGDDAAWRVDRAAWIEGSWQVDRTVTAEALGTSGRLVEALHVDEVGLWAGVPEAPGGGLLQPLTFDLLPRGPALMSPEAGVEYGAAIAASLDWLIVADPGHDEGRGAVYAYHRAGGVPVHRQTLRAPTPVPGARFGAALALNGSRLLIGAPSECIRASCSERGAAYVFEVSGEGWSREPLHELDPPLDGARQFGAAMTWLGEDAAIISATHSFQCLPPDACEHNASTSPPPLGSGGCPADELPCQYIGTTFVAAGLVGEPRFEELRLQPSNVRNTQWGNATAASERWLAIAAEGDTSCSRCTPLSIGCSWSGAVSLFSRRSGTLELDWYLKPLDFAVRHHFGAALALNEDRLVVGAPIHCGQPPPATCTGSGGVYVFEHCAPPYEALLACE